MGLLEGKVAFVTGGARNIGLAIAERFCEEGARVVIGDVDGKAGEQVALDLVGRGLNAVFVRTDVTDEASLAKALAATLGTYGSVDIVVANAGVHFNSAVVDMPLDKWNWLMAVNLTGVMLTCKVFGRQLVDQGRGGRIIIASSQAGKTGYIHASAYCASKFAVIGLVESLALEMAEHNITVNGVCPGNIESDMLRNLIARKSALAGVSEQDYRKKMIEGIPMKRLGRTREVADAYLFLASPLSSYISGETINVDAAELSGH
jgi:NAD(P)-dependent dehydrogenase (short-subunit alcohol dehydrogenase family)